MYPTWSMVIFSIPWNHGCLYFPAITVSWSRLNALMPSSVRKPLTALSTSFRSSGARLSPSDVACSIAIALSQVLSIIPPPHLHTRYGDLRDSAAPQNGMRSYVSRLLHTEMPAVADYDMVENVNTHYLPRFHQLFCNLDILTAWCGVTGWVIVCYNNVCCRLDQSGAEHFSWMNDVCVERTNGYGIFPDHLVLGIQAQLHKMFLL